MTSAKRCTRPHPARLAALPLLLAGCTAATTPLTTPPPAAPPAVAPAPLDDVHLEALARLLQMEDERALDLEDWSQIARDPHPEVRARAVLAAGRVADPRARTGLLAAMADSAETVRAATAFALGLLGGTEPEVLAALGQALAGGGEAAVEAAAALARLDAPGGYESVRARLEGFVGAARTTDAAVLRACLLALWRFRQRPGAAPLAASFAGHRDPEIRWAATYALTRTASAAEAGHLLRSLQDPDPQVRATATRGLRGPAADSAGLARAAHRALLDALGDGHPHVRIGAAHALATFRDGDTAPALLPLLHDPDGHVRVAAAEALAALPGSQVHEALAALATDRTERLALRATALAGLARSDSAGARTIAAGWTAEASWRQRFYAARALGILPWPSAGELLTALSRDPDPRVQAEAFGALADSDTSASVHSILIEGLAAADPIVRAQAAAGLARRREAADYAVLMEAYDRARRDSVNDAALASVDALAGLAAAGAPVASAFFLRFGPSPDPVVRGRVARHFGTGEGTWGPPRPTRTGRDDTFYRVVVRDLLAPVLAGGAAPRARIRTARGDIVIELDPAAAPLTVHNFLRLVESGFYRTPDLWWHRVVPNFVLQGGDPRGDGSGSPPHSIRDEINRLRYGRGAVGMALSGPDTGGSQFFITHSPQPHLDGGYTIFGRVVEGLDVADVALQDDPVLEMRIER